ncbi:MAG: hypothetical protein ACK4G3_07365, partial [bacterium]
WQIPHFWLLSLYFQKDYSHQPYPAIVKQLSTPLLCRITFLMILATGSSTLLLPLSGAFTFPLFSFLAIFSAFMLILMSLPLLRPSVPPLLFRAHFFRINTFALFILSLLIFNSII